MTEKDVDMKDATKTVAKTEEVKVAEPVDPFFGKTYLAIKPENRVQEEYGFA